MGLGMQTQDTRFVCGLEGHPAYLELRTPVWVKNRVPLLPIEDFARMAVEGSHLR
jgi:hypothetical protein